MNLKDHFIHKLSGMYCFADTPELCDRLLQAGARIIQLREKKLDDQRFYELGRAMLDRVRRFEGAVLIVNDRVDVALKLEAHGIHIGQEDEHYRRVIQKAPPSMIVGVSVDNAEQAGIAESAGADYLGAGAVFSTATKADAPVIGIDGLRSIVNAVGIPVAAIGGITLKNLPRVIETGARYYAVISELNSAPDISLRYREFLEVIGRASLQAPAEAPDKK